MKIDVGSWLESLGLGEYSAAFAENHVDGEILADLTAEDLKEIGVTAVGHRRKMLTAIAALGKDMDTTDFDAIVASDAGPKQFSGERRQVTVLFSDLSGFTKLSSTIDSEVLHALLAEYFEVADGIISDFGGTVDKHVGDSVMAVFGAPVSHGNDAERAVRAAVAIQEAMSGISDRVGRVVEAHIGVASGEVVASGVGPDSHYTVIGDSVNLAARLTDKAKSGEVFVSDQVRHAVTGPLEAKDIGLVSVKGLSSPVRVYSVGRRGADADEATERPFVGRTAELRQFAIALEVCRDSSQAQIVQIRGDAGIGKTRMTNEFCRLAAERGFACHRSLILDFGVGKGQDPIRTLVRGLLDLPEDADIDDKRAAARRVIAEGAVAAQNEVHLNDLLDLPQSDGNRTLYDAMDNQTRNIGKTEALLALVRATSGRWPLVVVFEDLHWAERLLLHQIAELGRRAADLPVMIVMTSRIEGDPIDSVWRGHVAGTSLMTLDLGPLSAEDAMEMVEQFVGATDAFARTCIERAAGNPLFLEQLLRSSEEAGDVKVPGTVQSIVQARLDRLPPTDKSALQAASVLGQRFSREALQHLIADGGYDCQRLVRHQLVREQDADYLFVHALVRDGVYGSLLRTRRNMLHLAAADWFAESDLPLRAEHLERAEHPDAADAYWAAAQEQVGALRLEHARRLAERGVALAAERETSFALNALLGKILRELGEPECSIAAYEEAFAKQGNEIERCLATLGIAEGKRIIEQTDEALGLLDEAQPIAEVHEMKDALMRLHHLRGNLLFPKGDIAGCESGHRKSIEYANEIGSARGEARGLGGLGDAAYVAGRMQRSHDLLARCIEICREIGDGRTEVANAAQLCHTKIYRLELREAMSMGEETIAAAQRVGHRRAELNAGAACLFAAAEIGDWPAAEKHGERVLELGEMLGSVRFSQEAMAFLGVLLNGQGRKEEALASVRAAIAGARKLGLAFGGPRMLGHLARITDDPIEADRAIAEANAIIKGGCVGHNHFFFYRDALEVMIGRDDWDKVVRYADALADFPPGEMQPWSNYYSSRARALANWGLGARGEEVLSALTHFRDEASRIGLIVALPALDRALRAA